VVGQKPELADKKTGQQVETTWLAGAGRSERARWRLFCLPYAGGAASIYRVWRQALPEDIDVCAVELPGRGTRMKERPYTSMSLLVDALSRALLPFLDRPFAFFGHSMGAVLAFEVSRHLRRLYRLAPMHLFLSGHVAPHFPVKCRVLGSSDEELLETLKKLSGTPAEVLQNPELMELLMPVISADFTLCDTYCYLQDAPLECPVSVFGGTEDEEVEQHALEAWRGHTTGPFVLRMLPGGHFFLHSQSRQILEGLLKDNSRFMSWRR